MFRYDDEHGEFVPLPQMNLKVAPPKLDLSDKQKIRWALAYLAHRARPSRWTT